MIRRSTIERARRWTIEVIAAMLGVACVLVSAACKAEDLQSLPEVRAPVFDSTGSLSADQIRRLSDELRAFEQRKGSQIAVVLISTTKPESIEQYSIRLAERLKVGRSKVDDGVLVLVAVHDRKTRIEVGYGLEGVIPDVVANQIRREVMNPYFRNGDFYGGVRAGVIALMGRIEGEALPPAWQPDVTPQTEGDWIDWIIPAVIAIFVFGGTLRRIFGRVAAAGMIGGAAGVGTWLMTNTALLGGLAGALAFIFALMSLGRVFDFLSRHGGHGWSAGSGGGSWSGGGHWSGGGGGFGGGGASGSWDD